MNCRQPGVQANKNRVRAGLTWSTGERTGAPAWNLAGVLLVSQHLLIFGGMSSTLVRRHLNAPRASVYRALLDARAVAKWKVPDGMTCHVHEFNAFEGGSFRISLTYDAPTGAGKTTAQTDT
jgi:hypothetical protein